MTIVAATETRNSAWANDQSSFGRKMLAKMGWKGDGLGKNQQGTSTHLRAVKRAESLGIGAESDAFGDQGWKDTNAGFHGVLASLKAQYGEGGSGSNSAASGSSDDEEDDEARKRRRKEEKRRKRKEEKRRAKREAAGEGTSGGGGCGVRLAQNRVQAGHARKLREAKDIRNKSAEDMAAIFGVKADFYKQPRQWVAQEGAKEEDGPSKKKKDGGGEEEDGGAKVKKDKKKKIKKEKRKRDDDAGEEGAGAEEASDDRKKRKKEKKSKK